MAKTANLYARIEPDVKAQAEDILAALGIPVSNAINMFYKQIILQRGIPFELKLPSPNVPDMSKMTQDMPRIREQTDSALQRESIKTKTTERRTDLWK